jgi:anti-sigma factor RsiW
MRREPTVTNDCHNLDAYLDGELAPGDAAHFAVHLATCPMCREAVDEQLWIDGLLRCPATAQLETPSPALVQSFRDALARRIHIRRWAAWSAAAAAAVLIVAIGWTAKLNRQADGTGAVEVAVNDVVAPQVERPAATFVAGPDVIAVPVASPDPNVTIVRLYSVYEPDYSAQASLDQTTTGDEFTWPDLNGG